MKKFNVLNNMEYQKNAACYIVFVFVPLSCFLFGKIVSIEPQDIDFSK